MLWSEVLTNWENGTPFAYPKTITGRFQWNTSVLKNEGNVKYLETFRINKELAATQNAQDFEEYFKKSKNKHVVSFMNLGNDTMLVVPMPVPGKNYVTLKDFIDNASYKQQQEFWKKVAKVARKCMKDKGAVWISVHGLGVDYTHVRISYSPKYYFDNKLMTF
jgi:hypothetical protein